METRTRQSWRALRAIPLLLVALALLLTNAGSPLVKAQDPPGQENKCHVIFLHCTNQLSGIFNAQDRTILVPTPQAYDNLLESQQRTYDRCIAALQDEGCI